MNRTARENQNRLIDHFDAYLDDHSIDPETLTKDQILEVLEDFSCDAGLPDSMVQLALEKILNPIKTQI